MNIIIRLHGCDDSTVFPYEVTDEQYNFLKEIAKKSKEESSYGCMPIMELEEEK